MNKQNQNKMKIQAIRNVRQQNFLAENGIFPLYMKNDKIAFYEVNKKFNDVMDYYFIRMTFSKKPY